MPAQDTSKIKEKILFALRTRGPSLPVHIAKEIETDMLFASAFLSELLSEKKIKISHMKVGSSPLYFIPGQEPMLENFSHHLKSREKDAFILLKQKKILRDREQLPAIRVALRAIKDFAIPFEKNNKLIWRYFTAKEDDFAFKPTPKPLPQTQLSPSMITSTLNAPPFTQDDSSLINFQQSIVTEPKTKPSPSKETLNIFDKPKKKTTKKILRKKPSERKNEKFFNKVKEYLAKNSIEITSIEGFSKNDLTLKIKKSNKELLLIAYNKKRLTETDIINAHKKAKEQNLNYTILSLGEPVKKLTNFIDAVKDLEGVKKIK